MALGARAGALLRAMRPLLVTCALAAHSAVVRAQAAPAEPKLPSAIAGGERAAGSGAQRAAEAKPLDGEARMAGELALLEKRRLAPAPARSVEELDLLLGEAHQRAELGRKDEAALLLLEAVEGPRFRSFESLDSFAAAELALASLMIDQHALTTAQRSVERLLARGTKSKTFGPAYRRAVDIALARRDYARSAERLTMLVQEPLPVDASAELHYLRSLAAYDARRNDEAVRELGSISKASRFYPGAQYLLGAIAAQARNYDEAHARFCTVRRIVPSTAPGALYGSPQLVPTDDDARLGLARVAHERGRSKEAFDHYFQISADSPLLAEALFEAAYASYERGQHTTALDSLEQLEARYPGSPLTAEARVLRGYAHLGRCDFARAERELITFERTFGQLLQELDATLASESRTHSLYENARASVGSSERRPARGSLLEALVARDPEVERLRASLLALDAELARSGNTSRQFATMAAQVRRGKVQHARLAETAGAPADAQRVADLRERLKQTRAALALFTRELSLLRRGGAAREELARLADVERALWKKSEQIEASLRAAVRMRESSQREPGLAEELGAQLEEERDYVARLQSRAQRVRDELERELWRAERRSFVGLRERLAKELRRARIGRIDAVMGKKRKLELEVESLAAGRFPAELSSRKQRPALLRDDEEYWPYEGEDWPDGFREPRKGRKK